ncbi:MAG: Na(+)-translocating NADH-quinone reductase subunit A [Pseudomonadota bacterium]
MQVFSLQKGLNLPITGTPEQIIHEAPASETVALVGPDYLDLKPRMQVEVGQTVHRGEAVFFHKDLPGVNMVAPLSGEVKAINRGARRFLQSVEIAVSDPKDTGLDFSAIGNSETAAGLTEKLCAAGLWTSFRTRPYSKLADPQLAPSAIFVTATETEPLAPDPQVIIEQASDAFERGLKAITLLTEGDTFLCQAPDARLPGSELSSVKCIGFSGPHPAGLAGTHIHFLHPPQGETPVWTIGYQDVIAIGRLIQNNHIDAERVIALGGPACARPRLLRTVQGTSLTGLVKNEVSIDAPIRIISGSVLSGRMAADSQAYLGRYARQVTLMEEDLKQHPMGWIRPMISKFAVQPVLGSAPFKRAFPLTTNLNGGRRAMVPTGTFEELMPQDYLPTQLLRALLVMDTDTAQALGALELDEEDLGLVGFACPAKYEYGIALRDCLRKIEKEG